MSAEAEFAEALAKFQTDMPHVGKDNTAEMGQYSYTYADLTDITAALLPLLASHGLSWTASPTVTEAGFVLRFALIHTGGHREGGDYPLPDPAKASPQQIGSALTYARRYALTAVTGLAPGGDDDDGAKASDTRSKPEPVTDLGWMDGFRVRVAATAKPSEVRGLVAEAQQQYADGNLTRTDAINLKALTDERLTELTAPVIEEVPV